MFVPRAVLTFWGAFLNERLNDAKSFYSIGALAALIHLIAINYKPKIGKVSLLTESDGA